MTVPYSFANATVSIPLSQLDANFNTAITLGNTAIQLGNTVTTLNNMTLANVTISSGNVTITNVSVTTANVTTGNITNMVSGNVTITGGSINGTTLGATTASTANVTTLTTSSTVTINGGTANGVAYLDGSKVLTTGSALTFDGTKLTNTGSAGGVRLEIVSTGSSPEVSITSADTGTSQINFGGVTTPKKGVFRYSDNSDLFIWFLNSTAEQMRLTSTGLGIGTSSPVSRLQVGNGTGLQQAAISGGGYDLYLGASGGAIFGFASQAISTVFNTASVPLGIGTNAAQPLIFGTGGTEKMRLDSSGNLGLGTTTPASFGKFAVRGAVNLATWGDTSGHFSDATTGSLYITHSSNKVALKTDADLELFCNNTGDSIIFSTNATERARITSGGNLLVGKTSSDLGTAGIEIFGAGYGQFTANNDASLFSNRLGSDGDTVKFYRATSLVGSISVTTSATAYNTSSDYRLKDNPQPLTGSGAFIDSLKPKTWNWKTDGSKGVGFIAHEVQEVSPASVTGEKDGEQMQAMEYGSAEFIANIIAELQSLRARVAQLEAK